MPFAYELIELALGKHCMREIETRKLGLLRRAWRWQIVDQPVIEWPMIRKLERAKRVRYTFDGVGLSVSIVVSRIDTPGVPVRGCGARRTR